MGSWTLGNNVQVDEEEQLAKSLNSPLTDRTDTIFSLSALPCIISAFMAVLGVSSLAMKILNMTSSKEQMINIT